MEINLAELYEPVKLATYLHEHVRIDTKGGLTTALENILVGFIFTLVKTKGTRLDLKNEIITNEGKDYTLTNVVFEDKETYLLFESLLLSFWDYFDFVRKGYTVHEYRLTESEKTKFIRLTIQLNKDEYSHSYSFIIPPEFIKDLPMKDLKVV